MKRREFIKYVGITSVPLGVAGALPRFRYDATGVRTLEFELAMTAGSEEMIDGRRVFVWAFQDRDVARDPLLTLMPGPVIQAYEGDRIIIGITNNLTEPHQFAVPGLVDDPVTIPAGRRRTVRFDARTAGTYMYQDPLNKPVNRVLGLHGALVVNQLANNTPYGRPTRAVRALFDELGREGGEFPGHPWDIQRQMIWILNEVDPKWNAEAEAGRPIDAGEFVAGFVPRYFTLNGRSGCDAAHAHDTHPEGKIGEPMLIRTMNAGAMIHGPHVHGNHVLVLARDGEVLRNVFKKDTFVVEPGERVDVLLPFIQPPDIPDDAWPPRQELTLEEFRRNLQDPGKLTFPMHPHNELSQTAAGGNYPMGMLTDWTINGPF